MIEAARDGDGGHLFLEITDSVQFNVDRQEAWQIAMVILEHLKQTEKGEDAEERVWISLFGRLTWGKG